MLDNYQHIAQLITKFNNGTLTETEHDELDNWITADDRNQLLFEELSDSNRLREYLQQMESYDEGGIWEKIKKELPLTIIPIRHLFPWKKIAVAASIILAIGLCTYFNFFNKTNKEEIAKLPETKDVEAPKVTKAIITMADGRTISIDSLTTITQGNVKVTKTADGKIIYSGYGSSPLGGTNGSERSSEVRYNTLTNPRGSKVIDVQLPDGSHVWLNAGSSITYPLAVTGKERKVQMTGEAYFEVMHNSALPFIVSKGSASIQVLGTHFNVNAYDDEPNMKVTLLEGSVKVMNQKSSFVIKPGQQAQVAADIRIVDGADLDQVMAWKNGMFQFEGSGIEDVMRQIARWYDVEVIYEVKPTDQHFRGGISREVEASKVFKMLESTEAVHFRIEGKKVYVIR